LIDIVISSDLWFAHHWYTS